MQTVTADNIREQPFFNLKEVIDTNSSGQTTKPFYSKVNTTYPRIVLSTSFEQIGKDVDHSVKYAVTAVIVVVDKDYKYSDSLSKEIKGLIDTAKPQLAEYNLHFDTEGGDSEPFEQGDALMHGSVLTYIFNVI